MTNTPKLAIAIGYIDDDLVTGAIEYMPTPKRLVRFKKHFVAVAACFLIVFGIVGTQNYLMQYALMNNIQVHHTTSNDDLISAADVTPVQAEKIADANNYHNLISSRGFEWYSSCYYDLETDIIMIGLTENTEDNQKQIVDIVSDSSVQFINCEFSYQYLESIYNSFETRRFLLNAAGVKRYNISVESNRVNVYVAKEENYAALYLINELDTKGAVVFKTTAHSADSHS